MTAACTCEPSAFCPTHGAEGWRDDPVRVARDALRRVQTGRVWFEPYSNALNPIVEAIKALDKLAGFDNVAAEAGKSEQLGVALAASQLDTEEQRARADVAELRLSRVLTVAGGEFIDRSGLIVNEPCSACDPNRWKRCSRNAEGMKGGVCEAKL